MTRVGWVFALVTAAFLLAAGCTSGDSDGQGTSAGASADAELPVATAAPATTAAAAATATTAAPASEDAARSGGGGDGDTLAVPVALQPIDIGRDIIFTAQIDVAVDDVALAGQRAQTEIAGLGGILFGQNTSTEPSATSVLTFKVFPEDFQEALDRLGSLGDLVNQSVSADDVTERIVDLRSRITTSSASVDRLRTFLEGATDLQQVAALESQLLERETQLELLRGQLRTLENQVSLATIVLVLTEKAPPRPEPAVLVSQTAYPGVDGGQSCPGRERVSVDEDALFTVCVEVTNVGSDTVADVRVEDNGIDFDPRDLIVIVGDIDRALAVGDRLIVAYEADAGVDLTSVPVVFANPIDDFGQPIREPVEVETSTMRLTVVEDDSRPGFGDAFSAGVDALVVILSAGLLALGAFLPFIWVPVVVLIAVWWLRRRNALASVRVEKRTA